MKQIGVYRHRENTVERIIQSLSITGVQRLFGGWTLTVLMFLFDDVETAVSELGGLGIEFE